MAKLKNRKDGRYQRKVTLSDGRQRVVYGRTLAELNAAEDALRDQDHAGLKVGDHTLVGEWAKVWIDSYKTGCGRPRCGCTAAATTSISCLFWAAWNCRTSAPYISGPLCAA